MDDKSQVLSLSGRTCRNTIKEVLLITASLLEDSVDDVFVCDDADRFRSAHAI